MSFREHSEVIQMVNIFIVFKEFECLTPSSQNRVNKFYPLHQLNPVHILQQQICLNSYAWPPLTFPNQILMCTSCFHPACYMSRPSTPLFQYKRSLFKTLVWLFFTVCLAFHSHSMVFRIRASAKWVCLEQGYSYFYNDIVSSNCWLRTNGQRTGCNDWRHNSVPVHSHVSFINAIQI
jgi:hypothetical protein